VASEVVDNLLGHLISQPAISTFKLLEDAISNTTEESLDLEAAMAAEIKGTR
jgi:hypothetical protein